MKELLGMMPEYIFETSWEVCNKVGGIYTVLSTRALTMTQKHGRERVVFVGPWIRGASQPDFVEKECGELPWGKLAAFSDLPVKVGYWDVPGHPLCVLVDYKPLYAERDKIYYTVWERFGVRGDIGYGDYDESCLFAVAAARTIRLMTQLLLPGTSVLSIFNEWTTGLGVLYLRMYAPEVATLFITHATTVGRSICGNGKPLYGHMCAYNGDQMAQELHVECKHQLEKSAAHLADAFGVVSELTQVECRQLLEKPADSILCNGFEADFVPDPSRRNALRDRHRLRIRQIVHTLYGKSVGDDALIIATSGRNEYRNKGIDVYLDMLLELSKRDSLPCPIIALILVPGWVKDLRKDLELGLSLEQEWSLPMQPPFLTHELYDQAYSPVVHKLEEIVSLGSSNVFPVYIPAYLSPSDRLLGCSYYDLLPALDLTLFPSYYEPWGYTPLESIALSVPTITTDKSGFGLWAKAYSDPDSVWDGVRIISRADDNHDAVVSELVSQVIDYAAADPSRRYSAGNSAESLSRRAYWSMFYKAYEDAYLHALTKMQERTSGEC